MNLYFLLDPNIAYIALVLAFILTILALFSPGSGFLEVGALTTLLAAGYSIANMPVNNLALLGILIGTILVIISIRRSVKWYFLALAIALIVSGSAFLFKADIGIFSVDPLLLIVVSASLGAFIWMIGHAAGRAFRKKVHRDLADLIGMTGRAVTDIHQSGSAYIAGEEWSAESNVMIKAGSKVIVVDRKGFVLQVEKAKES